MDGASSDGGPAAQARKQASVASERTIVALPHTPDGGGLGANQRGRHTASSQSARHRKTVAIAE